MDYAKESLKMHYELNTGSCTALPGDTERSKQEF